MLRVVTISLFVVYSVAAFGQSYTYAAGLGNLPQDQGWTYHENGTPPEPTNVGGFLNTSATTDSQLSYWEVTAPVIDFVGGCEIAARAKMINSTNYSSGGFDRAGWNIMITDDEGRFILAGISNDSVHLRNGEGTVTVSKTFDTHSDWHEYRLAVENLTASLYIDGLIALTSPVSSTHYTAPNSAFFGDSSVLARSEAQVHWVYALATVPEPSSLAIGVIGGLALLMRRRAH